MTNLAEDQPTDGPALPGIDTSIAHTARVYDYLLGGKDNYAVDRAVADQLMQVLPVMAETTRRNREFVLRAVRFMVGELGIDQIVDIGTGIPTSPAVHEVAKQINPATRVACVDNDPIVLVHDRALLERESGVMTFDGDLTDPASVIDSVGQFIDWSRPVGLIFAAVFHFVPDELGPLELMAAYRAALVPGSAITLSHFSLYGLSEEDKQKALAAYRTSASAAPRDPDAIAPFFDGLRLVEPGLVNLADWRPEGDRPETSGSDRGYAGVGLVD